ncbi:hypothetical protein AGOR_G00040590 [Albula goreensis]|uniref:Uncharacterized protein n=1 Tax=Albula goreensis TaxID=1534307 RepID=A0A8T3E327_9TELE|nr:hypothetical protein AGOR_G00040590 [Albula goreensis]
MEILAKAAIAEICELVDDGYAVLHLELSRSKKEIEGLKRKLRTIEARIAGGSGEGTGHSCGEAQVCGERQSGEELPYATAERDFSVGSQMDVNVWREAEPIPMDNETSFQSPGNKTSELEEEKPEMIIIKKEGPDDVDVNESQDGLKDHERAVESDADRNPAAESHTLPAAVSEELPEQQKTKHNVWEDNGLDTVLKTEPEAEAVTLQNAGPDLSAGRLNSLGQDYALYERSGQLDTFFTRGSSEPESEGPACSFAAKTDSEIRPGHSELQLAPAALKVGGKSLSSLGPLDVRLKR